MASRLLATHRAPGDTASPVVPAGRSAIVATTRSVAGSTRTTVFVRQSLSQIAVSVARMYHGSTPTEMVSTTRSFAGSMRTRDLVSPLPAQTAPREAATALGRSQLRMRKSPCGVWWIEPDSQPGMPAPFTCWPAKPLELPTATLPIIRSVFMSIFQTVPSPEFATHAKPGVKATPTGLTEVWIVTDCPRRGACEAEENGPEHATTTPAAAQAARTEFLARSSTARAYRRVVKRSATGHLTRAGPPTMVDQCR